MPLIKGSSKKARWRNFQAEKAAGKPEAQAWAIAYSVARKSGYKDKKGGRKKRG